MSGTISIVKNYPTSIVQGQSISVLGNEICLPDTTPQYELLNKTTGASLGVTALTIGGNNWVVNDGVSFYIASTGGGLSGGFSVVGGGTVPTGLGSAPFGMGANAGTVYAGGRDSGNLYTAAGGSFPVAPNNLATFAPNIISAGGFLWAIQGNGVNDILWKLNLAGGVVSNFALGFHSLGMTTDGASLWMTDATNGQLRQVDFAGAIIGTFALPLAEPGRIIYDGTYLWIGDILSGIVTVFDTSGSIQDSLSLGGGTIQAFCLDGSDVWVNFEDGAFSNHAVQLLFTPDVIPVPGVYNPHVSLIGEPFNQMPNAMRDIQFFGRERKWVNFP
jgi:hypothetical protein